MMWDLPIAVEIDGKEYAITNKCDYRMILDVICALNDNELNDEQKIRTALYIFYEDISECTDIEGSSRMYITPHSAEPICVASRILCAHR